LERVAVIGDCPVHSLIIARMLYHDISILQRRVMRQVIDKKHLYDLAAPSYQDIRGCHIALASISAVKKGIETTQLEGFWHERIRHDVVSFGTFLWCICLLISTLMPRTDIVASGRRQTNTAYSIARPEPAARREGSVAAGCGRKEGRFECRWLSCEDCWARGYTMVAGNPASLLAGLGGKPRSRNRSRAGRCAKLLPLPSTPRTSNVL
jgi:hypothetical protein